MPPISFRQNGCGLVRAGTTGTSPGWGPGPPSEPRTGGWPPAGTGRGSRRPRHRCPIRGGQDTRGDSTRPGALPRTRRDPRPHCIRGPPVVALAGYACQIMSNSTVGVGADDLVTGEAVALELPAAGIAIRALSGFLDLLTAGAASWIGLFVSSAMTESSDEAIIGIAMTLLLVVVTVVLPTTLETLTRGRSVGKLATGLR